jgi:hypothetical protein
MATKKKHKGVLEKIGDAVASGAEVVIDAGSPQLDDTPVRTTDHRRFPRPGK